MVTENGFRPDVLPSALVISRPENFSDSVLASVVLKPARKTLPAETKIFLLVHKRFAPLYVNHPDLDGIFAYSEETTAEELATHFKKRKIDALAHLEYSELVAKAAEFAGVKETSAFERQCGGNAKYEILDSLSHRVNHEVFHNFEVLAPFGIAIDRNPRLNLSVHADALKEAFAKIEKYGMKLGAQYAVFCLDPNRVGHSVDASIFAKLAEWLNKNTGMPVLVLGSVGKSNADFLRFCSESHGAMIIDLRGETTPAEDAQLLKEARLCITGENAHAYLAAAMNCPAITLFVDFSAGRWFPLGYFSTNVFTGATRFPFEPLWFYNRRASRAFSKKKIASALKFSLALKEFDGEHVASEIPR